MFNLEDPEAQDVPQSSGYAELQHKLHALEKKCTDLERERDRLLEAAADAKEDEKQVKGGEAVRKNPLVSTTDRYGVWWQ